MSLRSFCAAFLLAAGTVALAGAARADLRLPAVLGDHMVLQRETDAALWGWASPGEVVEVRPSWAAAGDGVARATAGADGRWRASVRTPGAGGPHTIALRATRAGDEIVLADVLIGEVWVCSGQSNMEWTIDASRPASVEQDAYLRGLGAELPEMRLFDVGRAFAPEPRDDCEGAWRACTTESVRKFSAVGYWFGKRVHTEVGVPVGLIGSNWGGTVAESWTSEDTIAGLPDFAAELAKVHAARDRAEVLEASYQRELDEWWAALDRKDPGSAAGWQSPEFDDSDWNAMELPREWQGTELQDFDGVAWFRRSLELPPEWTGADLVLELGPIDDMDTCWFNGERVGGLETNGQWQTPRRYTVPARLLRGGHNLVAVRVLDTGGGGGLHGKPRELGLTRHSAPAAPESNRLPLDGTWRWRVGAPLSEFAAWPASRPAFHHNSPTALFNGMLAPLTPFAIRGAIWYQGESNRPRAHQYRTLFPAMIADWRKHWGRGDFPFYYVQIAPFAYGGDAGEAAELREAQTLALRVPNTGMAVTMDVGEARDIHPKDKQTVGGRLALWALARTYGEADVVYSGPLYESMQVEGGAIRLAFEHATGGLIARGGALTHFAIAGADRAFVPATASVEGETVLVSSPEVPRPVAVRFAWGAADEPNLFNAAGLPSPSFRTDSWPGLTQ